MIAGFLIFWNFAVARNKPWVWPAIISGIILLCFSTFGAEAWNALRIYPGSGIPQSFSVSTNPESPGKLAFLAASLGCLLGALFLTLLPRLQQIKLSTLSKKQIQQLLFISVLVLAFWILGQGSSIFYRTTYLQTNGLQLFVQFTGLAGPVVAVAVFIVISFRGQTYFAKSNVVLALAWWVFLLSAGTRFSLLIPAAFVLVVFRYLFRFRRKFGKILLSLIFIYFLTFLTLVTFSVTALSRSYEHGLFSLPNLLQQSELQLLNPASWFKELGNLAASFTSAAVITDFSAKYPPSQEVIWLNANPLPSNLINVDAYTQERMWPLSWVPLSFMGEFFGLYGIAGQVALYFLIVLLGGFGLRASIAGRMLLNTVLLSGLILSACLISIQYPSRWFWRITSIEIALSITSVLFYVAMLRRNKLERVQI